MQSMMIASQHQLLRKQASGMASSPPKTIPNQEIPEENNKDKDKDNDQQGNNDYIVIESDPTIQPFIEPTCPDSQVKTRPKKSRRGNLSNSWLGLLNPSYKSRSEEFKKLFFGSIPVTERLVVDYSCALQKVLCCVS